MSENLQQNQDAAKRPSSNAVNDGVRRSGPGAPSYNESTCAWMYFVPELAVACELRELNKQMAYLIEERELRELNKQVTELVQRKERK
jgi:hypothetical protein